MANCEISIHVHCNVCPLYIHVMFRQCDIPVGPLYIPIPYTSLQYSWNKTSLQYICLQNQFTVQLYTKPVYSTAVHKTSLQYSCTQNQFTKIQ